MNSFFLKGARPVLWNQCKYREKIIGKLNNINFNMEYIYFFCDWEMKYVFHSFGPLASFQDVKSIYRVVLVLFYSVGLQAEG